MRLKAKVRAIVLFSDNVLMHCDIELFYRDFFEPPSRTAASISPKKGKASSSKSQVRFHEEVRVRKIKATGKNRSIRDDSEDEEEDDDFIVDDDDEEESGDDEGEANDSWGGLNLDGEEDSEEDSEGDSEEGSEDASENSLSGGDTIQRLKHDLFAEEEEDNQDGKHH